MIEYAVLNEKDAYPQPCHVKMYSVYFTKCKDKEELEEAREYQEHIITSTVKMREFIRNCDMPVVFLCITEKERKVSVLADKFLRMKCIAKVSDKNPNHGGEVFHDIWYSKQH